MSILRLAAAFLLSLFKSQRQLILENLALKQQVAMLRRSVEAAACHGSRQDILDTLFTICRGLAPDTLRSSLRYGCEVISTGLPPLLAAEKPTPWAWKANY